MPFQLTTGAIWGIGVGAFGLTLVSGLIVIVLYCRLKERRRVARIFSDGERRLSGYPGGHLSITDEDVARMPGTRRARDSNHASLGASRGWTAISSRESLPRRPVKTTSKQPQTTIGSVPVWPLPPRLTRSTAAPLLQLNASLQCPAEKEDNRGSPKLPDINFTALDSRDKATGSSSLSREGQRETARQEEFTASALKPKPLFHSKQRSISAGLIIQRPEGQVQHPGISRVENHAGESKIPKSYLPRSASLCSQHAGTVPNKPIPPLPFNFSATNRFNNIKSLTEASSTRASGNSLLSGDTSILDDCMSRALSRAETNVTSVSTLAPHVPSSEPERSWMSDGENHGSHPSTSGKSSDPRRWSTANETPAKSEVRKSCRASIVQSLPRSASSGLSLSLSLAPAPSRNVSSSSLNQQKALPSRKPSLMVPETREGRGSRRGKSPASPLRNSTKFDSAEELMNESKSLSTLQVISGNEGTMVANHPEEYLSSSENNVFQWDPVSPMQPGKPSAIRDRAKGHLRQTDLKIKKSRESNVRISDIPLTAMSSPSSPVGKTRPETPVQGNPACRPPTSASNHGSPRPPTRVTFDPQIISNTYPKTAREVTINNDSPTLSIFHYNSDNNSSFESLISSPSPRRRTPIRHRQSGSNPNRLKPVFSHPGEGHWSLMNFDSSFTSDPRKLPTDPVQATSQAVETAAISRQSSTPSVHTRPYSFTCPIPPEHALPTRRNSPGSSPIRGPRAAPGRRSGAGGIGKSSSQGRDLRKSILALRRQNSEAQNSPLPQHRNYLAIDNRSERSSSSRPGSDRGTQPAGDIFRVADVLTESKEEEEGAKGQKAGSEEVSRSTTPVMMMVHGNADEKGGLWGMFGPEQKWRPESPGTLYDSNGFLKE